MSVNIRHEAIPFAPETNFAYGQRIITAWTEDVVDVPGVGIFLKMNGQLIVPEQYPELVGTSAVMRAEMIFWTTLYTSATHADWPLGVVRTFTPTVTGNYRYYLLTVTANQGNPSYTMIDEFYLLTANTTAPGATQIMTPAMTSNNSPAPYVAKRFQGYNISEAEGDIYLAYRAFNQGGGSGYQNQNTDLGTPGENAKLQIDLGTEIIVPYFGIKGGTWNNTPAANPKNFIIQGGNEGDGLALINVPPINGQYTYVKGA